MYVVKFKNLKKTLISYHIFKIADIKCGNASDFFKKFDSNFEQLIKKIQS